MNGKKLLGFVEDPGAANWFVPLAPALRARGYDLDLCGAGTALAYLAERETPVRDADGASIMQSISEGSYAALLVGTAENPDTLGHRLVDTARACTLPSIGIIDLAVNAAHRFRGNGGRPLEHAPDFLVVPDREAASAFSALGFAVNRIATVGQVHLESILRSAKSISPMRRAKARQFAAPGIPADRPLWVFVSEVGYAFDDPHDASGADFSLRGRGNTHYRTAVVLEELIEVMKELDPAPWLVVRLHPKNKRVEFDLYRSEIQGLSQFGDPVPLIMAADAVVGMTSMLMEEAAALGRPTLSILPRPAERDWLPGLADGKIPVATTREEVRMAVAELARRTPSLATSFDGALDNAVSAISAVVSLGELPR